MASVFKKPNSKKWWARVRGHKVQGKWGSIPTPYLNKDSEKEQALRFAKASQKEIDRRYVVGDAGPMTVANYAKRWLAESSRQALSSIADITGHVNNHIIPRIGAMLMSEVRPRHIRDLIRALKADTKLDLAPKTIRNIYGTLSTMFHDAVVDEVIIATPVVVKRDELPAKVDKDSEWRELAMYTREEMLELITNVKVPPDRRVQYALKALAGLRHGEVAGVLWSHWNEGMAPLTKLSIARSYTNKRTKTDVTRPVPVHPALARILAAWRELWPRVYGRQPTPDDFIVPTRTMKPVDPSDAGLGLKLDMKELGMRIDAGEHRDRGGHDMRAWFISTAVEDGADITVLQRVTHTKKKDVVSGYTRLRWDVLCEAVAKLKFELGADPLGTATWFVTREQNLRNRWYGESDPDGIRTRSNERESAPEGAEQPADPQPIVTSCDVSRAQLVARLVTGPGDTDPQKSGSE